MAKLVTAAAFSFVLLIGALYTLEERMSSASDTSVQAAYFQQRLDAIGVELGEGQRPIEGWTAGLLMARFPGIEPQDFDGAKTFDGMLAYRGGTLSFEDAAAETASSAGESLTQAGFGKLLSNISTRLNLPANDTASVDAIIAALYDSPDASGENDASARLSASIGESVSALGMSITPLEVLEDSRCPAGVQCIWAGRVRVRVSLESGMGSGPQEFTVGETITTEAEAVTLIAVSPEKASGEISPSQYRFTFEVKKR